MRFYKYVTSSTGRIIVENRTLRWSTPPTLNDPFDMQFAFQLRINRSAVRRMAVSKGWQHISGKPLDRPINKLGRIYRQLRGVLSSQKEFELEMGDTIDASVEAMEKKVVEFNAMVRAQFENDKILCLSEVPDSIPMWAYYAQNHAGIVLRFSDQPPNSPLTKAKAVKYVEEIPSLFNDEMLSDMLAGYGGLDARHIMDEVTFTKSQHWAHEREWRVSSYKGRTDGPFEDVPFFDAELDGIIFGVRTTEVDKDALAKIARAKYPHAELLQAKAATNSYQLMIERANL